MLADATPSTVLAPAALALVLTDLAPSTVLALAALAFVCAHRSGSLRTLAHAAYSLVLTDLDPSTLLASAVLAFVFTDATPSTVLAAKFNRKSTPSYFIRSSAIYSIGPNVPQLKAFAGFHLFYSSEHLNTVLFPRALRLITYWPSH